MRHNPLGFSATRREILKIWEHNARKWPHIGPPWRPSPGDVAIYKKFSQDVIGGSVLILGATPEIRDLVARERKGTEKPILVDVSLTMLQKMSSSLKVGRPEQEMWIKADWCEVPLPKSYFDLIIGDMVWWVISVQQQSRLIDKIRAILAPSGKFISRFRFRDPRRVGEHGPAIVQRFLKRLPRRQGNETRIRDEMMSYLYDVTVHAKLRRIDRLQTKKLLRRAAKEAKDTTQRKFLREAFARMVGADWTSQTRNEVLEMFRQRLKIVGEARAPDYDSRCYPIFSFSKETS